MKHILLVITLFFSVQEYIPSFELKEDFNIIIKEGNNSIKLARPSINVECSDN